MQTNNRPDHEPEARDLQNPQDITEKRPRVANPTTPIPRRASALPPGAIRVRPRYPRGSTAPVDDDITRIPTLPQTTLWQYESDDYEAESSLASLSLVASETPRRSTDRLEWSIDELDTNPTLPAQPAPASRRPASEPGDMRARDAIADIDTAQLDAVSAAQGRHSYPGEGDLASWTAGGGTNSQYAARIVARDSSTQARPFLLRPLDNMRWWLLFPGRIEFLLWLVGTVLLMGATLILVLIGILSLGLLKVDQQYMMQALPSINSVVTTPCSSSTSRRGEKLCATSALPAPHITVMNGGPLMLGEYMQIHGQGFSPYGQIKFSHDANLPCYPDSTRVDGHGEFFVFLVSGYGSGWHSGQHRIIAYDVMSKRTVSLEVTFTAPPAEQAAG